MVLFFTSNQERSLESQTLSMLENVGANLLARSSLLRASIVILFLLKFPSCGQGKQKQIFLFAWDKMKRLKESMKHGHLSCSKCPCWTRFQHRHISTLVRQFLWIFQFKNDFLLAWTLKWIPLHNSNTWKNIECWFKKINIPSI